MARLISGPLCRYGPSRSRSSGLYRLLKAHDLITSPAYVVIKAADQFHTKTSHPNEMWQTDFTYFKIIGWGWMYLSTVLDDFSRYIIAWKLCTNMRAEDVTDTLDMALAASGCDSATVLHKPNRGFRHEVTPFVGKAHRQLPWAQLGLLQRQFDDLDL